MISPPKDTESELVTSIPPVICNNPREKIEPEEVDINEVLEYQTNKPESKIAENAMLPAEANVPVPRYPLSIEWSPSVIFLEIEDTFILQKIRIWNICSRSIYILCCGLWGETARLGAKWRCYPRTRFLISPGLTADLFIRATPREQSPIACAQVAIQLAAAHKRDSVVGYFAVPIIVKFKKYIRPSLGEVEGSKQTMST